MPTKPQKRNSRHAIVGRFFRGLPVTDALEPLRIVVNKSDLAKARRLDPNNCVFAQACRRLYDSHAVLVLRKVAYVELPDEKGRRIVNRFMISASTSEKIAEFDKTGEAPEGGFIFNAPSANKRMDAERAYGAKYKKAVAAGTHIPKKAPPKSRKVIRTMLGVRDGRGKLGINYAF